MSRLACTAFCLLLLAGPAGAQSSNFETTAPIELRGDGPFYQLTLPMQAHFVAHYPDLRDVRVLNGAGEAVPFAVIRDQPRTERAEQHLLLNWFPLYAPEDAPDSPPQMRVERHADGTIVAVVGGSAPAAGGQKRRGYLLDMSQANGSARSLALDWDAAADGFQKLSVDASDDLQSWKPWVGSVELARFEFNGARIERKQIDLRGGRAAYLRLTWQAPAEAPSLTAAELTVGSASDRPARLVWSEPAAPDRTENGAYEWEFPRPVAPERLKIELPQVNVLAPVEVAAKDEHAQPPAKEWRVLSRSVLYRLLIGGQEWAQPDLSINSEPVRVIRIVPDSRGGGLGGGAPLLSIGVTAQQLVFLARGGGPFTLAIGNDDAKPADLAPGTLMPGYGSGNAPPISAAELGPLTRPAGPAAVSTLAAAPEPGSARWQTVALWSVLVLGIGVIGIMALRLLRETKA